MFREALQNNQHSLCRIHVGQDQTRVWISTVISPAGVMILREVVRRDLLKVGEHRIESILVWGAKPVLVCGAVVPTVAQLAERSADQTAKQGQRR